MFEIGFSELLLIFVIALVVLGPERLPKLVAQVGRWAGKAKAMARQFREQLESEVNLDELNKASKAEPPQSEPPKPWTESPAADAPVPDPSSPAAPEAAAVPDAPYVPPDDDFAHHATPDAYPHASPSAAVSAPETPAVSAHERR